MVNGLEYRWNIRRRTYEDEKLTFAVERVSDEAKTKLVVRTEYSRPNGFGKNPGYIRPSDVASAIQTALETGWDPFAGKGTFECKIEVGSSLPST
jgi:hypothetical protein